MIDADQAAVCSGLAAVFSAIAASASAYVAWQAKRRQTSVADFEGCLAIVKQLGDAQRAVRDANDVQREFEFIELLNLMEALALLLNEGRPASSTNKVAGRFLEEALSWISITPSMAELMRRATTGDETFAELRIFRDKRAFPIRNNARHYRIRRDTQ